MVYERALLLLLRQKADRTECAGIGIVGIREFKNWNFRLRWVHRNNQAIDAASWPDCRSLVAATFQSIPPQHELREFMPTTFQGLSDGFRYKSVSVPPNGSK
jgi:hypothetical protein